MSARWLTPVLGHACALAALALLACAPATLRAQDSGGGLFYLGAGAASGSETITGNDIPYSIGIMAMPAGSPMVIGIDIAGEGEMFDSTFGGEQFRQALSINLLVGGSLYADRRVQADAALLVGARETVADCPDSFLGFQCYADADPTIEYSVNYGALLVTSIDRAAVGLRVTTESTQLAVGFRF